jgi:recombination protein RecR
VATYPPAFLALVEDLARLPGVGSRTAGRLAYFLLRSPSALSQGLAARLAGLHQGVRACGRCFNLAEGERCGVCSDPRRDQRTLCVVEEPKDLEAIERTGEYRGLYHVLMGVLSPLEGIGPDQLRVKELLERIRVEGADELIVAVNPDVEGEATVLYLARLLKPLGLKVTRLASGLPLGAELEFTDQLSLARALQSRREL